MMTMDQWRKGSTEGANPHFRPHRSSLAPHTHPNPNPNPNPIPCQHRYRRKPSARSQVANHDQALASERLRCPPPAATNSVSEACLKARAPKMTSERLKCPPPAATRSILKACLEAKAPSMTSERLRCPPPAATNSLPKASLEARAPGMTMNEWWGDDKADLRRQAILDSLIGGEERCIGDAAEEQKKSTKREERRGSIIREQDCVGAAGEEWKSITREERRGSLIGGGERCIGNGAEEQKKSTKREERRGSIIREQDCVCASGEEWKSITREERRGSEVGENHGDSAATVAKVAERRKKNSPAGRAHSLEGKLAGIGTMSKWWAVLSECVGTKRSLLHDEIVAFCAAQELTAEQARARGLAQDFLQRAVLDVWPNAEVHLYGSTAMGLALPTSDIDIVVVMQPTASAAERKGFGGSCEPEGRPFPDTGPWVSELYRKLYEMETVFQSLTQLPHAKVPILKAVFKSGVACDISFDWQDNRPGRGVQIVRHYLRQYKDLKPLCILLKSFLKHHKLNEVFTGGIGSFCLTIMVVSLLQNLPCEGAAAGGPACHDLGALLVSFFMYYSCMHNYATDVVSTRPGPHAPHKHARRWVNWSDQERLAVENPLDPTSDIGSASYNIHDVRVKFSQAKRVLLRHWNEKNLLDRIFKSCIV